MFPLLDYLASLLVVANNHSFFQVELLVNILTNIIPDLPGYLLQLIIVDLQRQPQWMDIALPKGKRPPRLHARRLRPDLE